MRRSLRRFKYVSTKGCSKTELPFVLLYTQDLVIQSVFQTIPLCLLYLLFSIYTEETLEFPCIINDKSNSFGSGMISVT